MPYWIVIKGEGGANVQCRQVKTRESKTPTATYGMHHKISEISMDNQERIERDFHITSLSFFYCIQYYSVCSRARGTAVGKKDAD